jgi:hypothetical protein
MITGFRHLLPATAWQAGPIDLTKIARSLIADEQLFAGGTKPLI